MKHQKPATSTAATGLPSHLVHHDFRDVDELAEVVRGWGIDFRQLNRGRFSGSLLQLDLPGAQLGRARLEGVVHQRGNAPDGVFSFAVPDQRITDLLWRSHRVGPAEVLVYQPSGEIECTSQRDFEVRILSISEAELEGALQRAGFAVDWRRLKALEVLPVSSTAVRALRAWIGSNLESAMRGRGGPRHPLLPREVRNGSADLLVHFLAQILSSSPRRRSTRRRRLVEEAVSIARDHARDVATVTELCRLSGASERTLRRGFQERFGTSPKAYLHAQRLIGVRRKLRATGAETPISDIANEWGFWHMGQFAGDYRRHFGELPSQTARCAKI